MDEEIKQLVEIRKIIEKKIEELKTELELFQLILKLIDRTLSEKSFKSAADLIKTKVSVEEKPLREYFIRDKKGRELGRITIYKDKVELLPYVPFKSTDIPFSTFFIKRILGGMQKEDEEALDRGDLTVDEVLRYEIEKDEEGLVKKVIVYNYRTDSRLREIRNTFKWTLEKLAKEKSYT